MSTPHLPPQHLEITLSEMSAASGSAPQVPFSVCRVHPRIKKQEPEAFEPKFVAIGPLQRYNKDLDTMREFKIGYLNDILARHEDNEIGKYFAVISECETEARKEYAERIDLSKDIFTTMLIQDGCFVVEFLLKQHFKEESQMPYLSTGVRWDFSDVTRDLMLLENQIPFFVLEKLFEQTQITYEGERQQITLLDIALEFLNAEMPERPGPAVAPVRHLLHLHHICLNPSHLPDEQPPSRLGRWRFDPLMILCYVFFLVDMVSSLRSHVPADENKMIPTATYLCRAGIRLKKKTKTTAAAKAGGIDLRGSFAGGSLEIPSLHVGESTSFMFRNLIALEQCCPDVGNHVKSYVTLMDCIIDTAEDVAVLKRQGIVVNHLGSNDELVQLVKSLFRGTELDYDDVHYNGRLFAQVKDYCASTECRLRAHAMEILEKYFIFGPFGNPLPFLVFYFTILQTFISILSLKQTGK